MRQSVAIAALTLLVACTPVLAQPRTSESVENYLGDIVIRTDGARVFVLLDTITDARTAPDGEVDQWFTLQTAEPLLTPVMAHLEHALVVHTARTLSVSTADEGYEFVLDAPKGKAKDPLTTTIAGVGLAHNTGGKGPRIKDQLDRKGHVVQECEWCLTQDPGTGGGAGGGTSCPSGGPGSTQCSATSGGNSCSITCAAGYYSCCQALPGAAYCRCIKG